MADSGRVHVSKLVRNSGPTRLPSCAECSEKKFKAYCVGCYLNPRKDERGPDNKFKQKPN